MVRSSREPNRSKNILGDKRSVGKVNTVFLFPSQIPTAYLIFFRSYMRLNAARETINERCVICIIILMAYVVCDCPKNIADKTNTCAHHNCVFK